MAFFGKHEPFTPWFKMPVRLLPFLAKRYPDLTDGDKLVVLAIMSVYPDRFPSSAKLARAVGLHGKTVSRALKNLRAKGLLAKGNERRVGIGTIQEVSLDPLWDAMAAKHPDDISVAELLSVDELMAEPVKEMPIQAPVQQIEPPPPPSPLSDADYAAKYGPPGATPEDAAIVRRVQQAFNQSVASLDEDILSTDKERFALAGVEDKALQGLANLGFDVETEESIGTNPSTVTATATDEDIELPKFLQHKNLPPPRSAPEILSTSELSPESQKKFYEETLRNSIQAYLPYWGTAELVERYNALIEETYTLPAISHQHVWDCIGRRLNDHIKDKARQDDHDWRAESARFGQAYDGYLEHCSAKNERPIELGDFRELFYRYGKFQEYVVEVI